MYEIGQMLYLLLSISVDPIVSQSDSLRLPDIFTDSLIFQRDMPIPVWGKSCKHCKIKVRINEITLCANSDQHGNWNIKLPPMHAGGPYIMYISDKKDHLSIHNILVGEVWLCSGQSNMEFSLSQSNHGDEEIQVSANPNIRFYQMTATRDARPIAHKVYSDSLIDEFRKNHFYSKSKWQSCNQQTASGFSAVAYYFGKELYRHLNVPIGLICNAVGGTTTQSFIDSLTLASHPQLSQLLFNREDDDLVHPWVRERINENLGDKVKDNLLLHPFAPSFLFNNGIKPIVPYSIKGAIWYQGESNATNPEIHDALFTALVKSWRNAWQLGDFPMYTVQLPKISNRSRWPEFRESQRRLSESILHSGMAVTIDTGDSIDVHPKEKKIIGSRLSLLALAKTYQQPEEYSGPVYTKYKRLGNEIELYFDHANYLMTNSDDNHFKGFYLHGFSQAGNHEIILEAKNIKNQGAKLIIPIPADLLLTSLRYAWSPYPDCNLINESGLPASPFKIEFKGNF